LWEIRDTLIKIAGRRGFADLKSKCKMENKGSRIRNIILVTLVILWLVLHLFSLLFDVVKHSRT